MRAAQAQRRIEIDRSMFTSRDLILPTKLFSCRFAALCLLLLASATIPRKFPIQGIIIDHQDAREESRREFNERYPRLRALFTREMRSRAFSDGADRRIVLASPSRLAIR